MIERMSEKIVEAMLEALPLETTVIDANDEVVGWNKHETRLFHRPMTSMGLNFRECHPQESLAKVEQIVNEMREGKRNKARFWIDLAVKGNVRKHKILRMASRPHPTDTSTSFPLPEIMWAGSTQRRVTSRYSSRPAPDMAHGGSGPTPMESYGSRDGIREISCDSIRPAEHGRPCGFPGRIRVPMPCS
jgi:hypothetical protein